MPCLPLQCFIHMHHFNKRIGKQIVAGGDRNIFSSLLRQHRNGLQKNEIGNYELGGSGAARDRDAPRVLVERVGRMEKRNKKVGVGENPLISLHKDTRQAGTQDPEARASHQVY